MLGFVAVAMGVSLSDRLPSLWQATLWRGVLVGVSVERWLSIDLVDRSQFGMSPDEFGHLMLWGAGMVGIGVLTRQRFQPHFVAAVLFGVSLALEVGQALVTSSRSMSLGDAVANAAGIMAGLTALVLLELAGRAAGFFTRWSGVLRGAQSGSPTR